MLCCDYVQLIHIYSALRRDAQFSMMKAHLYVRVRLIEENCTMLQLLNYITQSRRIE